MYHINQIKDKSFSDFYTRFTKELAEMDNVIKGDETICTFVSALGLRGFILYDILNVISVNTIEEMEACVKSYINLDIAKEGRKMLKDRKERCQNNIPVRQGPTTISIALY